jgi:ABC-2 type transport system permease protein
VKDFKIYLRYPSWIVGDLISTPLWFLFFALPVSLFVPLNASGSGEGGFDIRYFFWGWVFLAFFSSSMWAIGHTLRNEQMSGTLEQLLLTPTSRLAILTGRNVRTVFFDSATAIYFAVLFSWITGLPVQIANLAAFALVFFASLVMFMGFGMIYASLVLALKTPEALTNIMQFLVIVLAGVFFPVTLLPQPLFYVALALPFTYAMDMIKWSTLGIPTIIADPFLELILLYASAAACLVLGIVFFARIEKVGREKGSLGLY